MINMPSDITKLILPVPPGFGQVMGYSCNRKWVAFFWSPYGDELEYDDGHSAGTIDWPGWLAFVRHRLVWPLIKAYDFGSSESEATHWLLLDRQARQFYVGDKTSVSNFLQSFVRQFRSESMEVSADQLENLAQLLRDGLQEQRVQIKAEDIQKRVDEKGRRIEAMVHWLDTVYDQIVRKGQA